MDIQDTRVHQDQTETSVVVRSNHTEGTQDTQGILALFIEDIEVHKVRKAALIMDIQDIRVQQDQTETSVVVRSNHTEGTQDTQVPQAQL
ncbi:hypothetical protein C6496_13765 [Candidatus Poribacteria bacterium]|nr:MAG: hypothetical protein C6496_13765 [Candidatus Poribacteria bacterium]